MDNRKDLKSAYKQNPPPMGVYQIKNKLTGKVLIGSSMDLPGKKNSQWFQLKMDGHMNKTLQADWNMYGSDAFTFDILETIKTTEFLPADYRKALTALEEKWLTNLQPYDAHGYNKRSTKRGAPL